MSRSQKTWVKGGIESRHTPSLGRRYRARFKIGKKVVTGAWKATEQEARDELAGMRARKEEAPKQKLLTVGDAMALVLENLDRKSRRDPTVQAYAQKFLVLRETFPAGIGLHEIGPDHIVAYCDKRMAGYEERPAVSAATVLGDLRHFNRCFSMALRKGAITSNPIEAAKDDLPDPDAPRRDWFAMSDLDRILRKMRRFKPTSRLNPTRDAMIVEFLARTGIRLREVTDLTVGQIDTKKGVIEIHDGKRGHRDIPIAEVPGLATVTAAILDGRDRFRARQAENVLPLTYGGLVSMMRRWAVRLKEPRLHPHAMRHTFLTDVAARTGSAFVVMKLGGLKAIQTAMIYIHLAGVDVTHLGSSFRAARSQ